MKHRSIMLFIVILILLIAQTAASENVSIMQDRVVEQFGNCVVDANVYVPETIPANISVLHPVYRGNVDLKSVQELLMSGSEAARAVYSEIPNYVDYYRGNKAFTAYSLAVNDNGSLVSEIFAYDGVLEYTGDIPDEMTRDIKGEGVQGGWGNYSRSGIADNCKLTADEAKKKADLIVDGLKLPFTSDWFFTKAYSPSNETYLTVGYYEVYYRQVISGVPISINNSKSSALADGQVIYRPYPFYGIMVRVFDFGVQKVECCWFEDDAQSAESASPISFDQALSTCKAYFEKPGNLDIDPVPLMIDKITFEYAVGTDEKGVLKLVPCWSFLATGQAQSFYGLRISAFDGSVLLFNGWVI